MCFQERPSPSTPLAGLEAPFTNRYSKRLSSTFRMKDFGYCTHDRTQYHHRIQENMSNLDA